MSGFTFSTLHAVEGGGSRARLVPARPRAGEQRARQRSRRAAARCADACSPSASPARWSTAGGSLAIASAVLLGGGLVGTVLLLSVRLPIPAKLRPKVERLLESLRVLLRTPELLLVGPRAHPRQLARERGPDMALLREPRGRRAFRAGPCRPASRDLRRPRAGHDRGDGDAGHRPDPPDVGAGRAGDLPGGRPCSTRSSATGCPAWRGFPFSGSALRRASDNARQ